MGEMKNVYKIVVSKPVRDKSLRALRRRWEDNIKTGLDELVCGGADWIHLSQDRVWCWVLVNRVMNLWVP
jgi:hypothetical protein